MSVRAPDRPPVDWEPEQEVDFGRYWGMLVARWWLPLLGLIAGAIIGYLVSLGSQQVFKAQATIYLGQPYSASSNIQLQSAQTNPSTVRQIVNAESTLERVASRADLDTRDLRGHVSVAAVSGNLAKLGQTPLVTISVQGRPRRKVAEAANELATAVVGDPAVAGYASQKIRLLTSQIVNDERTIADIRRALRAPGVSPTDRLIAAIQLRTAQTDFANNALALAQAKQAEAPKIVTHAAATKVTARSRRNSVVVGAVIGLLLGILAALAWEPVVSRARPR